MINKLINSKQVKFLKAIYFRWNDDNVMALSSQLAYNLLMSFFPFLIFLITIAAFTKINAETVLSAFKDILPMEAYNLTHKTILETLTIKRNGLLSISFIATIWAASSGFGAVINGLNKAYDEKEKRSFFKVQILTVVCTIGLVFLIVIAFALLVFGEVNGRIMGDYFGASAFFGILWNVIRYIITFVLMIFLFAMLYRITPCKKLKWTEVFPGAIFTTILWILISEVFSFYINHFGNYSMIYGSLGAVIVLMVWLFISAVIVILGGEVNAELKIENEERQST